MGPGLKAYRFRFPALRLDRFQFPALRQDRFRFPAFGGSDPKVGRFWDPATGRVLKSVGFGIRPLVGLVLFG